MSPAKKKRRPPPVDPPPVVIPTPVLTHAEHRFWRVVKTKNLIGGTMFLLGAGFCVGFWVSDKAHGIEKIVLGVGVFLMIAGAHFLSSEPTERFLTAAGRAARVVLPGIKPPTP